MIIMIGYRTSPRFPPSFRGRTQHIYRISAAFQLQVLSKRSSPMGFSKDLSPFHEEIDYLTAESSQNASFSVIRMAQSTTFKVSHSLAQLKNSGFSLEEKVGQWT